MDIQNENFRRKSLEFSSDPLNMRNGEREGRLSCHGRKNSTR